MVGYNSTDNALTLGDDDSLKVGDYEVEYSADSDEFQARYGRPIGGEEGFHGEILGPQYSPDSQVGDNSMSFDGNNDYIDSGFSFNSLNEVTISLWVKIDNLPTNKAAFVDTYNGSYKQLSLQYQTGRGVRWFTWDQTFHGFTSGPSLNEDEWYHLVGTYDGTEYKIFVNGSETTSELSSSYVPGAESAYIGSRRDNQSYLDGTIDDVRFYDRALSESEVTDLFNGVDVTDGLVARYDFEYPETPDVAIDSTGDAYPKNSIPRNTSGSVVPSGLAESVSAGEALADDGESYSSVQDAVDAASGWVFVGPGTFNESVTIDTEGLTLEGCGYNTLIDGGTSGNSITVDAATVTITNLSLQTTAGEDNPNDCIATAAGCDELTVDGVIVRDSDQYGITIANGADHSVVNCIIKSADAQGIIVNPGPAIIGSCNISNAGEGGINQNGDDQIIHNCTVTNCGNDTGGSGIRIDGDDTIVIGNRVSGSGDEGLLFGADATDCIAANNRLSDSVNQNLEDNGTGTELDDNLTGESN